MAENRNAQQVREITDKLEQGLKELFESERFKEYLKTMSKFYNYSFNNTLLHAEAGCDADRRLHGMAAQLRPPCDEGRKGHQNPCSCALQGAGRAGKARPGNAETRPRQGRQAGH